MLLFYAALWLGETVPTLFSGEIPQSIKDNGPPTNAVHVLDMAWMLPACGITAIKLWRKHSLGYVFAGAILVYLTLLIMAIFGMVVSMAQYGQAIAIPQVVVFSILLMINLGMLIHYFKSLDRSHPMMIKDAL